jgi:hypothetical protein
MYFGGLLFKKLLQMDTGEYEIQEFSLNNQVISLKETLKNALCGAENGTQGTPR